MSTWSRDEDRLLLLELLDRGFAVARRSQAQAVHQLAELGWVRRTRRAREWGLAPEARGRLETLLDREWPQWRDVSARLRGANLPPTLQGWTSLREIERRGRLGALPAMLHAKTFAALTRSHSKVRAHEAPEGTRLTTDQVLRLRPSDGLCIVRDGEVLDASLLSRSNGGEVLLTQRALLDGTRLGGRSPRATLLVENLGAYLDLRVPDGTLTVHVPGWDSALVHLLLEENTTVPLVLFGDLDPAGVRMATHLRSLFPALYWWVPSFAEDYFEGHAQPCEWPEMQNPDELPRSIRALVDKGKWLEQEALVLDPRCTSELESWMTAQC